MQTRLDALQTLKDEVTTAEDFIADVDKRVRPAHPGPLILAPCYSLNCDAKSLQSSACLRNLDEA